MAKHNFSNIEHRGDVFDADFTEFKDFDYLVGGSPCTNWSIAQHPSKRETTASGKGWELFRQYVRALKEAKPKFFIYENNKSMSKDIRASIDEAFGFEAVLINSALVSAQNRNRLYWVGKRNVGGTYSKVEVEQPTDRGILLKDVLDDNLSLVERDKAHCVTTHPGDKRDYFKKHQSNIAFVPVCVAQRGRYADSGNRSVKGNGKVEQFYEARTDGKINTLTTVSKDNSVAQPIRVGTYPTLAGELKGGQAQRIYSEEAKSVSLKANGGGQGANTGLYAIPATIDYNGKEHKIYRVRGGEITINEKTYKIKLKDGYYIIRKLTVSECMRLQTVPEWYDFTAISNSQAYKCLGNGWTVDVIKHILKSIINKTQE